MRLQCVHCACLIVFLFLLIELASTYESILRYNNNKSNNIKNRQNDVDNHYHRPLKQKTTRRTTRRTTTPLCSLQYRDDIPYYDIDDDRILLRHLINVQDQTISIEITYIGLGWIGFAFTRSQSMIPNIAIIGVPAKQHSWYQNQVSLYGMKERDIDGVRKIQDMDRQSTLTDTSIDQNETHTILRFTKPLVEVNDNGVNVDVPVIPNAMNQFIWAVGVSNKLAFHRVNGYDTIVLDQMCDARDNDNNDNDEPMFESLGSINGTYSTMTRDGKRIEITLVTNSFDGTITIEMSYTGKGWIGIGFPKNDTDRMIDSIAVIGSKTKGNGTPMKYYLASKTNDGIIEIGKDGRFTAGSSATMSNRYFYQNDTYTYMKFTKPLISGGGSEPTISLKRGANNHFIYAVGYDNTIAQHKAHGSFTATAIDCIESSSSKSQDCSELIFNVASATTSTGTGSSASSLTSATTTAWKVHGICMALAWILLVPTAILCSYFRDALNLVHVWFHIHRTINMLGVLCTMVGFFTAVSANNDDDNRNSESNRHHVIGYIVFIFAIVQLIGGIFHRSPQQYQRNEKYQKNVNNNNKEQNSMSTVSHIELESFRTNTDCGVQVVEQQIDSNKSNDDCTIQQQLNFSTIDTIQECISSGNINNNNNNNKNNDNNETSFRSRWRFFHRGLGITTVLLAWINCHSGVQLYSQRYGTDKNRMFWTFVGCIIFVTVFLYFYQKRRIVVEVKQQQQQQQQQIQQSDYNDDENYTSNNVGNEQEHHHEVNKKESAFIT